MMTYHDRVFMTYSPSQSATTAKNQYPALCNPLHTSLKSSCVTIMTSTTSPKTKKPFWYFLLIYGVLLYFCHSAAGAFGFCFGTANLTFSLSSLLS